MVQDIIENILIYSSIVLFFCDFLMFKYKQDHFLPNRFLYLFLQFKSYDSLQYVNKLLNKSLLCYHHMKQRHEGELCKWHRCEMRGRCRG